MRVTLPALTRVLAIAAAMACPARAAADEPGVGVRQFSAPSETRGTDLDVTLWYPTPAETEPAMVGESIFFEGTPAIPDAPMAGGPFPLALLSHGAGLGGRAEAASWLAAPLAARGYIVAAPTHPGNTGPDRSAAETMKLWRRPDDISRTLGAITADADLGRHLAPGKVGVVGLSMGGHTALSLAGARIDPDRLAGYCDGETPNPSLCGWVRQSGVDLHAMDVTAAAGDFSDSRITFAVAIDPALVDVFAAASFADIAIPVALVNLGPEAALPTTVDASPVAERIADASYQLVEDASHYSMFAVCRPGAAEIARDEGIDEPICTDGGARPRSEIHAALVDLVANAFDQALMR